MKHFQIVSNGFIQNYGTAYVWEVTNGQPTSKCHILAEKS